MSDQRVVLFLVAAFIIVGGCGGGGGDSGTPAVVKATVSGTVLDSRNNPVPAATVTINSTPVTTSTNSSGYFSAEIETGDHEIIVEKAGYSMFNTGFSVPSSSPVDLGSLIAYGFYPAYLDSDDDGYGDPDASVAYTTDNIPTSYVASGDDCDDTLASVNPGASEVCNDVDDNCSGVVDEGNPGGGASCSTGLQGVCSPGTETCQSGSLACVQDVISSAEICDGLDNNCDGAVDEVFTTLGEACSSGVGECSNSGSLVCMADGTGVECDATAGTPVAEICDGLDNDCDGTPDDGNPGGGASCGTGLQGVCSSGTETCQGGSLSCLQDVTASAEICDGLDNDCDGVADDGDPGGGVSCATGLQGVCSSGTATCQSGSLTCLQDVTASAEICDGLDNDCDGTPDDGNPGGGASCTTGQSGVCSAGTQTCQGGALSCIQDVTASAEICDGLDNDCNGTPDDGNPGGGASCSTGQPGVCSAGTQTCQGGALSCGQDVTASAEVCDGLDNDCNGQADNGLAIAGTFYLDSDGDGYGDPAVADTLCGAIGGYVADNTDCEPSDGNSYPGAAEICDNIDNDCDTVVDNGASQVFYQDADYDGFGDATNESTPTCDPPVGYARTDTDCDDTDSTINPLAKDICEDGVDQDCIGGDLACPNYSIQASTISPIVADAWWDYTVSGDDTGWLYRYVYADNVESPETGQSTIDVRDEFDMDTWPWWLWDRFLFQDTDGTVRQAAMWWEDESFPNWVTTGSGGSFLYYPSAMAVGQSGSSTFNYIYDNSTGSYAYSVLAVEDVSTPMGSIEAFQIATVYTQSWPATVNTVSEGYNESNTVWLHPEIGEIKRNWAYDEYIDDELNFSGALSWTLQDGSYFDTTLSCGGVGGGSGWPERLEGTWYGGGVDDFIVGSYHDWYVTLTMDAAGNITLINLNDTDTSITGIVTAVDDSLYTIEFNDASTGQIIVDETFNYMVFIGNFGFSVHGTTEHSDLFFAVLQKGATSLPTYNKTDVDGAWNGFGYAYCSSNDSFYRFAPGSMNISGVNPDDPRTVTGVGPSPVSWPGSLSLYSDVLGWWRGSRQDTTGMLFLRLSPDKQFAGAYLEVNTGRYLVPEDLAFFAMH